MSSYKGSGGLIKDPKFDQIFGEVVNHNVNLSSSGMLSIKIKLSAYDTHWVDRDFYLAGNAQITIST